MPFLSTSGQMFEINSRAVWNWCGWLDRAALEFLGFVSWIGGKSFIAAPSLADGSCHARPTDPPAPPDSVQPFITNGSLRRPDGMTAAVDCESKIPQDRGQ